MTHSNSIAFCADCGRPISARAMRCGRCAGAANRGVARAAAAESRPADASGALAVAGILSAPPAPRRRTLTPADRAEILAADAGVTDVDLAWRFGVGAAEIARVRGAG